MSYSSEVLADSPIVYLKLDETSGTVAADSSGNGRDWGYVGSYTQGATSLLGAGGGTALALSGGHVSASDSAFSAAAGGSFTIEMWVKVTSPTTNALQVLADHSGLSTANHQWFLFWDNRSTQGSPLKLGFTIGNGGASWTGATARDAIAAGGYLVCEGDATSTRIYWNNVLVATGTAATGILSANRASALGSSDTGTFPLTGTVDEFALYDHVLGSTRRAAHYAAGTAAASPITVAGESFTVPLTALDGSAKTQIKPAGEAFTSGLTMLDGTAIIGAPPVTVSGEAFAVGLSALSGTAVLTDNGIHVAGTAFVVGHVATNGTAIVSGAPIVLDGEAFEVAYAALVGSVVAVTDLSNNANGRDRQGSGVMTADPPVVAAPSTIVVEAHWDKAIALPMPTIIDGRPT